MIVRYILGMVFVGFLAGCTTTRQQPTAVNQLQIRIAQMERRMDEQDQDAASLKETVDELSSRVGSSPRSYASVGNTRNSALSYSTRESFAEPVSAEYQEVLRVSVSPQHVQTALKNAGYYKGAIDGKLGAGSQSATRAFQKDHNLKSDGIIGKQTWTELKNYLE